MMVYDAEEKLYEVYQSISPFVVTLELSAQLLRSLLSAAGA